MLECRNFVPIYSIEIKIIIESIQIFLMKKKRTNASNH